MPLTKTLMCAIIAGSRVRKAIFMMIAKRNLKKGIRKRIFGCFFAIFLLLFNLFGAIPGAVENVYAAPEEEAVSTGESCQDTLEPLGWLVCPAIDKISKAADFLYDKIEDILVINPVEAEDGSPVYEVWKYFQGVTNIVFVIFLLVIVFSQITGWGINNYGIKKALPKLIIAAVLVNLSFYICSLLVDVSNIFGGGLRGLLESVEASAGVGMEVGEMSGAGLAEMYTSIAAGTIFSIIGIEVGFETGAIWMLIPLVLGALVSVVIGLVTIAMRQAVVVLLIMIAPLAMIAYILPNTEQWFKKWKRLFFQMLIFYPAFSLLFGASSLAGWAIIASSNGSGFAVLIGVAVQIFPLFFSWSLMKMSGTILGTINSKLNGLASRPLGGVRGWAESHRELSKYKHLASRDSYTPSMKLQKFLSDRKIARDEETKEHAETVKNRGLAYAAMRNYKRGTNIPSKEGEEAYEAQARNAEYSKIIERHKNNMSKGLGQLEDVKQNGSVALKARLGELDAANVRAFDTLKMEQARGEMIEYENAVSYHKRMQDAVNAHIDEKHRFKTNPETGERVINSEYKMHFDNDKVREAQAKARYADLSKTMEGNLKWSQYAEASAAQAYDTQAKIVKTKMQTYMDLTPPTQDVVYRLDEWTKNGDAANNMDAIVSALRVINGRGDTDIVKQQIDNVLAKNIGGGLQLGTHGSQALASFLMFDVKDSDPWLRRFGKYINLETARMYNNNDRKEMNFDYDEYVRGYHMEFNEATGQMEKMFAKKGMKELMEGTSLDNVERTAFGNFDDSLKKAYSYVDDNGQKHLNVAEYLNKREEVQTAIGPAFISASLKYLSGSEQLVNAVGFWTGYTRKQKKEVYLDNNGVQHTRVATDEKGEPIYEWKAEWENGGDFADDPETARKYFQRKTLQYISDQTPSQILGLRSDYKEALLGHFSKAYEEANTEDWDAEAIFEHEECMKELAEIQTRYGDLPPEEAKRKRDADIKKLRNRMTGAQFRQLLNSKGKLNQIYRTRRSGAANNAKDWVREWLDLDNETAITLKLEDDKRREKAEFEKMKKERAEARGESPDADGGSNNRVYTDVDMASFVSDVDDLWHDLKDEDDDIFYNESLEYVEKKLSKESFIAAQYKQFRKNDPYADSHTLKEYLTDLLNDPENY